MAQKLESRSSAAPASTAGTILLILAGPIIWSTHLGVIYTGQSVLCTTGREGWVLSLIVAATLASLVLAGAVMLFHERLARAFDAAGWNKAQRSFNRQLAIALSGLSMFAIAAEAAGVFLLPPC